MVKVQGGASDSAAAVGWDLDRAQQCIEVSDMLPLSGTLAVSEDECRDVLWATLDGAYVMKAEKGPNSLHKRKPGRLRIV